MKRALCTLALLTALMTAPAFGQGCAMCWTSANGASSKGKEALDRGILVLLVTTLGLVGGFVGLTVGYSRRSDDEDSKGPDEA